MKEGSKMNYVYILQSAKGIYFTGCSDNLDNIVSQHKLSKKQPIILVHQQSFYHPKEASIVEQKIRSWTNNQKQALINNDWSEISKLAKYFI
jgi:predicted GIY-YIG superfamily endonuclease